MTDVAIVGFAGDFLAHPTAALVLALDGSDGMALNDAQQDAIINDVSHLLHAARGWIVPYPHEALADIKIIRGALANAETAAARLPKQLAREMVHIAPDGRPVLQAIQDARAVLDRKLDHGERVASRLAELIPGTKDGRTSKKARNEAPYRVATVAREIFERRTGTAADVRKRRDKAPASDFGRFVEALFGVLFHGPGGAPEWYAPARWAVTSVHKNK